MTPVFTRSATLCFLSLAICLSSVSETTADSTLTPPATPLVTCDPYFSIWSAADKLTDANTTHWTGKEHRLTSLVRIDGKAFRLMGAEPRAMPALEQQKLSFTPTQSTYEFEGAGVRVSLTFTTPLLPEDIDLLSRPITYLTYTVESVDGAPHEVQIYFGASGEVAVNTPDQKVVWSEAATDELTAVKIGSKDQIVLGKQGDDIRIDWGYLYAAAPQASLAAHGVAPIESLYASFAGGGDPKLTAQSTEAATGGEVAAALLFKADTVGEAPVTKWLVLAYDDLYSIEYMQKQLRPYWRRNGLDAKGLLAEAARDYEALLGRCEKFDQELVADLTAAGGEEYAQIGALAYRQCFAAGKFAADANGQPLQFSKENHSNGCIGTSDVFYPMAPQFFLFGPSLAKSFLAPFMNYAESERWKFPFAPHDLGTYPKANGQVYGGGETSVENQMPVEESGNMLILMAVVARLEGHTGFADRYWPELTQWAEYLRDEGFDPDNQLCTDDFAGHLAHNVNLSAKAICGLGAFAQLCDMRGETELAEEYRQVAKKFAARWIAAADDGDHFRLTFDRPDTWSQKYNLVWDRVLGLDLFPDEVREKEMAYYRAVQNQYGLPLDNRSTYTKLDWILWSATLTQNQEDFRALASPVFKFLEETPDRVPMTDWYHTDSGRRVGFTARPVVGGVYMQMLYNDPVWRKWAGRDETKSTDFAPMPKPPKVTTLVPAADTDPVAWRFTTQEPEGDWRAPDYDDSDWREGRSGFGVRNTPNASVNTRWNDRDIWLRRGFDFDKSNAAPISLHVHHDEDAEIYINGVLAAELSGFTTSYINVPLRPEAAQALKATGNTFAVHCRQTTGGQYIDVGLVSVEPAE